MIATRMKIVFFVFLALLVGSCASVQVAKQARGTGKTKLYKNSVSEAWPAMRRAVINTGGNIKEENKKECSILAEYGVSFFSWGERIGVFCYEDSPSGSKIEVVSKRAVSTNITASDWTGDIYRELDKQLIQ